jgi:predicted secreted hydrolase
MEICIHRRLVLCLIAIFSAGVASAQEDFTSAISPWPWKFPRDHGRHDDFQIEWWYFTGNLGSEHGREFGYQLTIFRRPMLRESITRRSTWAFRDIYIAHFAISDVAGKRFRYDQRLSRGALGIAEASKDSLGVHLQNWSLREKDGTIYLSAIADFGAIELALQNDFPPALHGEKGQAKKGVQPGQSSYYYSLPNLPTRGTLSVNKEELAVSGVSWMDHEFGSNQLAEEDIGWDWFALHLPDSVEVMLYLLRRRDGTFAPYAAGSIMRRGRVVRHLASGDFHCQPTAWWTSSHSGARYPVEWKIKFDDYDLGIRAAFENQELDTRQSTGVVYWEGYVNINGEHNGRRISGMGYLEMTGYAPNAAPQF